jgi:hypothetical protein
LEVIIYIIPIPASIVPAINDETVDETAMIAKLSPSSRGMPPAIADGVIIKGVVSVKAEPATRPVCVGITIDTVTGAPRAVASGVYTPLPSGARKTVKVTVVPVALPDTAVVKVTCPTRDTREPLRGILKAIGPATLPEGEPRVYDSA